MRKLYLLLVTIMALGLSSAAFAEGTTYTAELDSLNSADARGTAKVMVEGNMVTVTIETSGMSPNLPHAQHLHIGGNNTCPTIAADKNNDGFISTPEGGPDYGPIMVSLTTTGDMSMKSGLAIDRFPVADANGNVSYSRTFELPEGVAAEDVSKAVIVQHGISELFADPSKYDGEKKADIPGAEQLPFEAPVPAVCGPLQMVAGMPNTGAGGASNTGVPVMGLALVGAALAAGALMVTRSRGI